MTMTISDLPVDLVSEIVCRVPLKDMRAVRLTCKKWDTLSKSGMFRKMHMCKEAARKVGESRMVALMDCNLHLISVVVDDVENPTIEIIGQLSCLDEQVKIIKMFNYEGLLLCVLKDSFRLVVWNPFLGQTKWIEPPSYSYRRELDGLDRYRYAMGYDHKKKSHKILRFLECHPYSPETARLFGHEMYDFESNLWRTLNFGTVHWEIELDLTGVPLNGNTYWIATPRGSDHYGLICFEFTSERFGPILPLPFNYEENRENIVALSCLKGDRLALLLTFEYPSEVEIWVTTMIDPNNVSWSKFLTVNTGPVVTISFSSMGLFIDEEKKVAMVFDKVKDTRHTVNIIGEAGFFREVDLPVDRCLRYIPYYNRVCSHFTPSLVQIQKPPLLRVYKRTRKQQSKRPCDQNKSRLDDEEEHPEKRTRRT